MVFNLMPIRKWIFKCKMDHVAHLQIWNPPIRMMKVLMIRQINRRSMRRIQNMAFIIKQAQTSPILIRMLKTTSTEQRRSEKAWCREKANLVSCKFQKRNSKTLGLSYWTSNKWIWIEFKHQGCITSIETMMNNLLRIILVIWTFCRIRLSPN